ncbi:hypothetical protein JIG36_10640 [Actinoplanes sp. LDG1-06]|uniref:Uncharacterized protein n=1 Tax=Paractinoplanes ovalisporus TaxID=2810368 RepID=A0ABS2A9L1_9ACTN|nr:hypothetical protein [Actinoplanes ovalisporus]MBM2616013.1 hypothetical protein [Actinoplanes ovalisporus]
MSRSSAAFWVVFGFLISIVDAWLSIQSMAGMMHAVTVMGYVFAAIVGVALTAFAVLLPIMMAAHRNAPVLLVCVWVVLTVADVGTSVVGVIWYVRLGHPLTVPVDLTELHYAPANWMTTLGYIASVLIVAWCCAQFGRALLALRKS